MKRVVRFSNCILTSISLVVVSLPQQFHSNPSETTASRGAVTSRYEFVVRGDRESAVEEIDKCLNTSDFLGEVFSDLT